MSGPSESVNVLEEDSDLARKVPPPQFDRARRDAVARLLALEPGGWSPADQAGTRPGALGLLVLHGVLVQSAAMAGRQGVELCGAGDLIRPLDRKRDLDAIVAPDVRWSALTPVRLAVLDARFTARMCSYPEVIGELCARLERRALTHALRFAIIQQPRLSERLRLLLWHLADRFGRVHAQGVALPLPLSHDLLAQLVGARRPSVSRALKQLEREQAVARRPDGSWWLRHDG